MKRPQAKAIAALRLLQPGPYPAVMVTSSDSLAAEVPASAAHMATSPPLVEVRDLHLTVPSAAGPVNILRGIDLDIRAGEAVGVVGPSGSGKTSLLMVLAGLEGATSGSVKLAGQELTRLNEDALARLRRREVGIVFQAFHLIASMTALENVAIPLELAGTADALERAAESLKSVGLDHRLTHRPRLLLADEPPGNLDGATGQVVMDLLFSLQARYGTTLMLITHDPTLAARCSRTIRIADGRIAG
jgi:putative ABC transport system ATP-binding protein